MTEPFVVATVAVEETEFVGEMLGRAFTGGEFVGLIGGMGVGKTAFARGVARGAGVPPAALVSSPTFAIVNAYAGGRVPLHHADLYRIADADELYSAGFYDLVGAGGSLLVEWLDRVPAVAPADWLEVRFVRKAATREVSFLSHGPVSERLVTALRTALGAAETEA